MKNKFNLITIILLFVLLFFTFYNTHRVSKKNAIDVENVEELRNKIETIKKTMSMDVLSNCSIEMDKVFIDKAHLRLDLLALAFRKAKIGGVSHPVNKCFFIFRDHGYPTKIMIEVNCAQMSSENQVYGSISICDEKGTPIYGIPYISNEMTEWAYSVGIFE